MTLVGLLVGMIVVTVMLTRQAVDVLPEVGRDQLGEDNWADPLGVHLAGPLQVARVPDCAAGAFTRLVLWDPMSDPYWEVEGPPTLRGRGSAGRIHNPDPLPRSSPRGAPATCRVPP